MRAISFSGSGLPIGKRTVPLAQSNPDSSARKARIPLGDG
jgi:hypothetical protein